MNNNQPGVVLTQKPSPQIVTKKKSQLSVVWSRYRRNVLGMLGLVIFLIIVVTVLSAPLYIDYLKDVVTQNLSRRYQGPSKTHILGTDGFGRNYLYRVIWGGRISLSVGLSGVLITLFFGLFAGAAAAYFGKIADNILMRFMDVLMAIPSELMAIMIMAALGSSTRNLIIAIGVARIPSVSRIVRSAVLTEVNSEYVEAAKSCGTSNIRIIFRHILPNAMGPILVQTTHNVSRSVLSIAGLSYIGLGISEPMPEWGSMLSAAKGVLREYPYLAIAPGVAIVLTVFSITLIGDALRDAMDPRLKN